MKNRHLIRQVDTRDTLDGEYVGRPADPVMNPLQRWRPVLPKGTGCIKGAVRPAHSPHRQNNGLFFEIVEEAEGVLLELFHVDRELRVPEVSVIATDP